MAPSPEQLEEEGYERVCSVDEIPDMMPRKVEVGGRSLLLCRDGGRVFAVDEMCPHKHRSMTYGVVHAGKIVCPHHQYEFELDTGRCRRKRCPPVLTYEVEVVDEVVFVRAGA